RQRVQLRPARHLGQGQRHLPAEHVPGVGDRTVPVSQPGRIPAGQVREELLSAYDLAPTLRQWCHLPDADDPLAAGTSFAGLLTGGEDLPDRGPVVVYDEYGPVRMIRTGR